MPEWLENREPLYRWPGGGYDGQYFHMLAHRPLEFRSLAPWMDRPRMRCRRILFPLLAWLLAAGRFAWVDAAYLALMALWLAAGVWSVAGLADRRGASAWWGLAFLALPASLGSVERMLVDGPLMAMLAGVLLALERGRWKTAWVLAAAAPFMRESGLLLPAAVALVLASRGSWKAAAGWAAACAPFLVWLYSLRDLPGGMGLRWSGPFASVVQLVLRPEAYEAYPEWRGWLRLLDLAALAGFLAACVWCLAGLKRWWSRRQELGMWAAAAGAAFAGAALVLCHLEPRHAWDSVFSAGRVFAPVYLAMLLEGLETGRMAAFLWMLAPAALRALLPYGPVAWRALQTLGGT